MTSSHRLMVGIDISKDKLDIAMADKKVKQVSNKAKAIKQYFQTIMKEYTIARVVFEATGGYEKVLIVVLEQLSLPFSRVHGTAVHHFIKARGQLGKTDVEDALALLG